MTSALTCKPAIGRALELAGGGWVVINPEDASHAEAACVVSVRNAVPGTPTFVVFVDKPVNELRRRPDLDAIDAAIAEAWPAYAEVLETRVEPVLGPDGSVINEDVWVAAPEPGYFDFCSVLRA